MSQIKISNLTEYTGNTYNGYVIWNDSGETTTYKTKYNGIFNEKIEIKNVSQASNTINSTNRNSLIVGYGNNISASVSNKQYFILGNNNTINSSVGGNPTNIVVGNDSTASAFGAWVVGSYSSASGERSFKWGNNGSASALESFAWGEQVNVSGTRSFGFGDYSTIQTNYSYVFGSDNDITGSGSLYQNIWGGSQNRITSSGTYNTIIGSKSSIISGTTSGTTLIGLNGFTSPTQNNTTYVDNIQVISELILADYSNLDFVDDAAAATGGVSLGGVYHNSGALRVRIS